MRTWCGLALVLAACGEGSSTTITIYAEDSAFVAAKLGDAFEPLPLEDDGVYELEVDGPYGFATHCVDAGTEISAAMFRAPSDGDEWLMRCADGDPVPTHTVTVTSADNTALIGGCGLGSGMGDTFTFEAPEGPCDLLFTDYVLNSPPTRVWRRNIEITGDTTVDVDVRDGQDMMGVGLSIDSGSNAVTTAGFIETPHGTRRYFFGGSQYLETPSPRVALEGDVVGFRVTRDIATLVYVLRPDEIVTPGDAPYELTTPNVSSLNVGASDGRAVISLGGSFGAEPRYLRAQQGNVEMQATWSDAYEAEGPNVELRFPELPSLAGWDPAWSMSDVDNWQVWLHHVIDDQLSVELEVY